MVIGTPVKQSEVEPRVNRPLYGLSLAFCCLAFLLLIPASGCVSKNKANAQARRAYMEGQQQAFQEMQKARAAGPTVTVLGDVRNSVVPWTLDLTLAKALLAAEYLGKSDPSEIVIVRDGKGMPVDPKHLLGGEDIPLHPQDVVQVK